MTARGLLQHFFDFASSDASMRRAVARATLELVVIEALLRSMSVARVCRLLGIATAATKTMAPGSSRWAVVESPLLELPLVDQRAVAKVARNWPVGGSCLRYSLALGWRLRLHHPVLMIGVRRNPSSRLDAHAWLDFDGIRIDFAEPSEQTLGELVPLKATATEVT